MVPVAPVPVAPEVIVTHAALEVAVQLQDVPFVARVKELVPPLAVKDADDELKPVTEHAAPS